MLNLGVYIELWSESFIQFTGVDCFDSLNHNQVQVLIYNKYSLLLIYLLSGLNLQPPDETPEGWGISWNVNITKMKTMIQISKC